MVNTFSVHLFITLFFLICQSSSIGQDSAAITIRIDPKNAVGGTASQVFDRVNYIPLETTKESLFGKIDQLAVTDKYFILRDENTNSILVFGKDGKFHSKIQGGNDNDNRNSIWNFSIDRSKKEIVFKQQDRIMHYDFEGNKVSEENPTFLDGTDFFIFPKDIIVYANYTVNSAHAPDSNCYELMYTHKDINYKNDLPYNMKLSSLQGNEIMHAQHSPFYESGNDTSAFYWRPYDYGIYAISPAGIRKKYNFILPSANSLPAAFVTNTLFTGKRFDYFKNNKEIIYSITHFYKQGSNLFFKLNSWNGDAINNDAFLYHLNSGNLISLPHISSDSSTYFLPLAGGNGQDVEFANDNFYTCDGEYLYTSHSSLIMFRAKELNVDRKIKYSRVLAEYFLKGDRKCNPVIIELKPKDNL